jgi:hypothetical protein
MVDFCCPGTVHIESMVYGVLYTVYGVLYTVYCIRCTVYCVLCTVYCVLCTVYRVLCTVYSTRCTVYGVLVYCVHSQSVAHSQVGLDLFLSLRGISSYR